MLAKSLFSKSRSLLSMKRVSARYFSADAEAKPEVPEPTKEELEANKSEWGLKYDDECFKFEKEWEIIAQKVMDEQNTFIESELGDLQKAKVEMLADKVMQLNLFEMRYFQVKIS